MRKRFVGSVAVFLFFSLACSAETLRVMTFNVRKPVRRDGNNRWELRQDTLVRAIARKDPDLLGTQELWAIQGDYIVEKVPEYSWLGNSRPGTGLDQYMGIFYKSRKFHLVEAGNYWLSETPEMPGSKGWGATAPRMVTWALFQVKASGKRFYFVNTHFQHTREGATARLNSAKLLMERTRTLASDIPLILTGDFNTAPGTEPYQILTEHLRDAWKNAAKKAGPEGTMSRFTGVTNARRIDWILYRGPYKVLEIETVTYNEDGRYPSDHYPVYAVLEY